jgi:hypothetical protein
MMDHLGIKPFDYHESKFTRGDDSYMVTDLIELSKKYEPFDLPIIGIDLNVHPWGDMDIKMFCDNMKRVNDTEMKYPIILDDAGFICDGWHRLVKAIIRGDKTIKAIRLTIMPDKI